MNAALLLQFTNRFQDLIYLCLVEVLHVFKFHIVLLDLDSIHIERTSHIDNLIPGVELDKAAFRRQATGWQYPYLLRLVTYVLIGFGQIS